MWFAPLCLIMRWSIGGQVTLKDSVKVLRAAGKPSGSPLAVPRRAIVTIRALGTFSLDYQELLKGPTAFLNQNIDSIQVEDLIEWIPTPNPIQGSIIQKKKMSVYARGLRRMYGDVTFRWASYCDGFYYQIKFGNKFIWVNESVLNSSFDSCDVGSYNRISSV